MITKISIPTDESSTIEAERKADDVARYLRDGALDARLLILASWGRIEATEQEKALGGLLRQNGLRALKAHLGLPPEYPVISLPIDPPTAGRVNNRSRRASRRARTG